MSEARKGKKQNPLQGRLEAQLKSKSASLPTPLDYGGAGNAVKGRDERQLRAPLTAFPAPVPPSVLTTAVVVIHGMTLFWEDTAFTRPVASCQLLFSGNLTERKNVSFSTAV